MFKESLVTASGGFYFGFFLGLLIESLELVLALYFVQFDILFSCFVFEFELTKVPQICG